MKVRSAEVRTHHLHIVAIGDPQWRNNLRFRDILRTNDTVRACYGEFKKTPQDRFTRDRKAYTDGKNDFIRGVLAGS